MKVKDFAVKTNAIGGPNVLVRDVFKLWIKEKINVFIVVDEEDNSRIKGIVTLYDILRELIPFYLRLDDVLANLIDDKFFSYEDVQRVLNKQVGSLMTEDVITIYEDDSFLRTITIMYHKNFDYLPVVDKENKFSGYIVTRNSVERVLLDVTINGV